MPLRNGWALETPVGTAGGLLLYEVFSSGVDDHAFDCTEQQPMACGAPF